MIPVYCPSRDLAREINDAFQGPGAPSITILRSKADFEHLAADRPSAVLVCPGVDQEDCASWIGGLVERQPATHWIVVAEFSKRKADALLKLPKGVDVVWRDEVPTVLSGVAARAARGSPRDHLVRRIETTPDLAPALKTLLLAACRCSPVPRSVRGLCRLGGVSERTLRRWWNRAMSPWTSPREFVEWLVLATALAEYSESPSWTRVARELGLKKDTLRKTCLRRTRLRLRELADGGPEQFVDSFEAWREGSGAS